MAIDNTKGAFKSAASALNHGAGQAKGKYLTFVHQDIDLASDKWLSDAEKTLDALPNLGAAGVAGVSEDRNTISNIEHGIQRNRPRGVVQIDKPTKVQTLDECLFVTPREVFDKIKFDEATCNDWHLYAVDYCLNIKQLGLDAFVIPAYVYHKSAGYSLSDKYYLGLAKVLNKHKAQYKKIYTTCGIWDSRRPIFLQKLYRSLKSIIGKTGIRYIWRKSGLRTLFAGKED
jgi:hypothetical protein